MAEGVGRVGSRNDSERGRVNQSWTGRGRRSFDEDVRSFIGEEGLELGIGLRVAQKGKVSSRRVESREGDELEGKRTLKPRNLSEREEHESVRDTFG